MKLSNWLCLPRSSLTPMAIDAMKKELVSYPRYSDSAEQQEPTLLYDDSDPDYFKVPVAWGVQKFLGKMKEEGYEDLTSEGSPITCPLRPNPDHPKVKDPAAQKKFMADLLEAARKWRFFVGKAPTGSGKTVCACNTIAELGRTALIVVHLERLGKQWKQEIHEKLGVPLDKIGQIGGGVFDVEGKDIVVGMLQSLSMKDYPEWVYDYFGTIVFDEVHKIAAPVFSQAAPLFNAKYRIGLSATPTRKDGADKVIFSHLGPIRVESTAEALRMKLHAMYYRSVKKVWGSTHGARVKCLTLDKPRNNLICRIAKKLYDNNREILIVSDSIDHLHNLSYQLATEFDVPRSVMGMFTGQKIVDGRRVKVKDAELEDVKQNKQIILATYSMMKEGIDIPRLDAGIDATPRADATQIIGRIRRPEPDKPLPVWYTLVDLACPTFIGYYKSRSKDYAKENVEIIEHA